MIATARHSIFSPCYRCGERFYMIVKPAFADKCKVIQIVSSNATAGHSIFSPCYRYGERFYMIIKPAFADKCKVIQIVLSNATARHSIFLIGKANK